MNPIQCFQNFCIFLSVYLSVKVVGSQARILYSNEEGRASIALAFNKAVSDGRLKVHLVSSTDCIIVSLLSVFISLIPRPSLSFSMPAVQIAKDRSWAGSYLGMKPPHAQWHDINDITYCHMMSHDVMWCHVMSCNVTWLSHDCHMIVTWLSHRVQLYSAETIMMSVEPIGMHVHVYSM